MPTHALVAVTLAEDVLVTGAGDAWTFICACGHTTVGPIGYAGAATAAEAMTGHFDALPEQDRRRFDERTEAAIRRTLKDLDDGHVTLWGGPHRVTPDRVPAHPTPDAHGAWWLLFVERGWLAPHPHAFRVGYLTTARARAELGRD